MRLMSFTHTAEAMRWRIKTVTRRAGWRNLKSGDRLLAVVKHRGRRPGEPLDVLGVIEVVRKSREPLSAITAAEVEREGFGDLPPAEFVREFCALSGCRPGTTITRIEFQFIEEEAEACSTNQSGPGGSRGN